MRPRNLVMIVGLAVVGLGGLAVWWLVGRDAPTAGLPMLTINSRPATGGGLAPGAIESMKEDRGPITAPSPLAFEEMAEGGEKAEPTPQAPLFEIESRDEAWAPVSERELGKRLAAIAVEQVQVASAICKTSTCQVVFAATEPKSLGKIIGKLETPEGVYGWADHLLLGELVTESSGTTMHVTLLFDR